MVHAEIYKKLKDMFPECYEKCTEYFPNGKNSIRVRNAKKEDMIFTFNGKSNWKLESVDSFLKSKIIELGE